jgi:hypothetical protein
MSIRFDRAFRLLLALLCLGLGACSIGRDYVGNSLRADPKVLQPGKTTLAEVLELFGAPDRIQRRHDGDVLTYRFVRGNTSELELEEPVVTGITFFVYTKRQLKANQLTLFFDDADTLVTFGYTGGVDELDPL